MNSQQPSTSLGYSSWQKHPWQQEISEITYNFHFGRIYWNSDTENFLENFSFSGNSKRVTKKFLNRKEHREKPKQPSSNSELWWSDKVEIIQRHVFLGLKNFQLWKTAHQFIFSEYFSVMEFSKLYRMKPTFKQQIKKARSKNVLWNKKYVSIKWKPVKSVLCRCHSVVCVT
jgi:hypothetical protein